ncbi:unnamed protein product [Musa acuminata var. zebrina]
MHIFHFIFSSSSFCLMIDSGVTMVWIDATLHGRRRTYKTGQEEDDRGDGVLLPAGAAPLKPARLPLVALQPRLRLAVLWPLLLLLLLLLHELLRSEPSALLHFVHHEPLFLPG